LSFFIGITSRLESYRFEGKKDELFILQICKNGWLFSAKFKQIFYQFSRLRPVFRASALIAKRCKTIF
jgi:hypothetical protein